MCIGVPIVCMICIVKGIDGGWGMVDGGWLCGCSNNENETRRRLQTIQ